MSKRSLFWNDASGKLGNTVMYRAGGEQRTRQYVANIKNPKTLAQMTQRVSMLNFVTMFKHLKYVLKDAFPSRQTNQSAWNAFVQANKVLPKVAITRSDANAFDYVPAGIVVSKGDIPLDTNVMMGDVLNPSDLEANARGGVILPFTINHIVELTDLGLKNTDVSDIRQLLNTGDLVYKYMTANGNPFNLPTKFKITVLSGYYQSESKPTSNAWRLRADQIECYSGSTDRMRNIVSNGSDYSLTAGIAYADFVAGEQNGEYSQLNGLAITTPDVMYDAPLYAVIISWTENGKTRVTNSMVLGVPADAEYVAQYRQDGDVYDQVLENLGVNSDDILATPPISTADASYGFTATPYSNLN